jgi:hypothetical protein
VKLESLRRGTMPIPSPADVSRCDGHGRARAALLRAFGARIGHGALIRHRVHIQWPWKLTVGRDSWIRVSGKHPQSLDREGAPLVVAVSGEAREPASWHHADSFPRDAIDLQKHSRTESSPDCLSGYRATRPLARTSQTR